MEVIKAQVLLITNLTLNATAATTAFPLGNNITRHNIIYYEANITFTYIVKTIKETVQKKTN